MTQIHVIARKNRARYAAILKEHHRIRHNIFVGERGWKEVERPDGLDIDAYDTDDTVYILALEHSRVVGGLRLCSTLKPHMMSEVFPHLAPRILPRGPYILECSRYFVVKERRTCRTDPLLLTAFQEFCLDRGITNVTAVVEMWWLPRWQQSGFKVQPLGLPIPINGEHCLAVSIEISEESLASVRRIAGLGEAKLFSQGLSAPQPKEHYYAA